MKENTIPKGVRFSFLMMSFPLFFSTGYLAMMAPLVSGGLVDPASFAYTARTCVRLLALNLSFIGGIHYGFASATYETATTDSELKNIKYQMIYSFIPATFSFSCAALLLNSTPLGL